MKTIIKKINVFKFDELKEDAKENVKKLWYDEIENQSNQFEEFANEILYFLGFNNSEVSYSLSHRQGDGLSFDFDLDSNEMIEVLNIIKNKEVKENGYKFLIETIEKLNFLVDDFEVKEKLINGLELQVKTSINNHHYSHSNTRTIEISSSYDYCLDFNEKTTKYIISLEDLFKSIYHEICDILENEGYTQIYYIMNDNDFSDLMNCNDYQFLEDGSFYYE